LLGQAADEEKHPVGLLHRAASVQPLQERQKLFKTPAEIGTSDEFPL